jgi:hypothetical protein
MEEYSHGLQKVSRAVHFCGTDRIVSVERAVWTMIDELAERLGTDDAGILETSACHPDDKPFESVFAYSSNPYDLITLRIIDWWNGLIYGDPVNENIDDPRTRNYRQDIDPALIAAMIKPKS